MSLPPLQISHSPRSSITFQIQRTGKLQFVKLRNNYPSMKTTSIYVFQIISGLCSIYLKLFYPHRYHSVGIHLIQILITIHICIQQRTSLAHSYNCRTNFILENHTIPGVSSSIVAFITPAAIVLHVFTSILFISNVSFSPCKFKNNYCTPAIGLKLTLSDPTPHAMIRDNMLLKHLNWLKITSALQVFGYSFNFRLFTAVRGTFGTSINFSLPFKSEFLFIAQNEKRPQALPSSSPSSYHPLHIPQITYDFPAVPQIWLYKVSFQALPTLKHHIKRGSARTPSSNRQSSAGLQNWPSTIFCEIIPGHFRKQTLMMYYQRRFQTQLAHYTNPFN